MSIDPATIAMIKESGVLDKILDRFGKKNKVVAKQAVNTAVDDYAKLKAEVKDLHAKLDAIIKSEGIVLEKVDYVVKKEAAE